MLKMFKGKNSFHFHPALFDSLRTYRGADFFADFGAGLTVACVALPLAMAFGIASGVKPEQGMITAIIGGALISIFGGSKVQIGGPAGAFVAMLYAMGQQYGLANLLLATMMAGVMLMGMGILRMGQIIRFVPTTIVVGFTNGIAVVIMFSQIKDFFGLNIERMPANFLSQIDTLLAYREGINLHAFALAAISLAIIFLWPKPPKLLAQRQAALRTPINPGNEALAAVSTQTMMPDEQGQPAAGTADGTGKTTDTAAAALAAKATAADEAPDASAAPEAGPLMRLLWRIPAPLVVLVLGTLATWGLNLPVETIGSRFGGIPQSLPAPAMPTVSWDAVQTLFLPAMSIAFLCAIESLLCARVADGMTGDRHDPNQELMAQGLANLTTPLFGGIAVTGTIARTVANVRSGGRTPIAGLVHAATLLIFMLVLAPMAVNIPMAVLAGILMAVGFNMGEWHAFKRLRAFTRPYRITLLVTFGLTVIFDLTIAVQVGLLLASLFFIYRVSSLTHIDRIKVPTELRTLRDGRKVGVWEAHGSLFFGSVGKIEAMMESRRRLPDIVVLDMSDVLNLDTTGLSALEALNRVITGRDGQLLVVGAHPQPMSLMQRSGFVDDVGGSSHFFMQMEDVYARLRPLGRKSAQPSSEQGATA